MTTAPFDTPIALYGPLRAPRQMLAQQEYGGHVSLHDDAMAKKLGFAAGPIEGPTHFSQFVPLLHRLWGNDWFETGSLSIHFKSPCIEGDQVRAWVEIGDGTTYIDGVERRESRIAVYDLARRTEIASVDNSDTYQGIQIRCNESCRT